MSFPFSVLCRPMVAALFLVGCRATATGHVALEARGDGRAEAQGATGNSTAIERRGEPLSTLPIEFAVDSAELSPADQRRLADYLDDVCAFFASHPDARDVLVIEGHADARAPEAHNRELSQRRAEAIRQWLLAHDRICAVDPARVRAVGCGELEPGVASDPPTPPECHSRQCDAPSECVRRDGEALGSERACGACWAKNRETVFAHGRASPPSEPASCSRVLALGQERGSRMCE